MSLIAVEVEVGIKLKLPVTGMDSYRFVDKLVLIFSMIFS